MSREQVLVRQCHEIITIQPCDSFSLHYPCVFFPTAIKFDSVQVFGYTAWSLVDGFEWNYGYTVRRGLFYIDFSRPNRTRTPKTSALYFQRVVADNGFLSDQTSKEIKGCFPCDFHWGIADSTLQVRR